MTKDYSSNCSHLFTQLAWSGMGLFQFQSSTACTITFHMLEIGQEPLGKGDRNDYVVLLIFQTSRERRKPKCIIMSC